ncbi:MAG TPA: hypothetical protein VL633_08430 [Bacteroidota bacterium]|nr:hypothetical protein [Bacteroidota bacterium]
MTESIKGRGASFNPQNRFESISFEPIDVDWDDGEEGRAPQTVFYRDSSKSIFAKNDSPDVPFTFSINPIAAANTDASIVTPGPRTNISDFQPALISKQRLWSRRMPQSSWGKR